MERVGMGTGMGPWICRGNLGWERGGRFRVYCEFGSVASLGLVLVELLGYDQLSASGARGSVRCLFGGSSGLNPYEIPLPLNFHLHGLALVVGTAPFRLPEDSQQFPGFDSDCDTGEAAWRRMGFCRFSSAQPYRPPFLFSSRLAGAPIDVTHFRLFHIFHRPLVTAPFGILLLVSRLFFSSFFDLPLPPSGCPFLPFSDCFNSRAAYIACAGFSIPD